MSSFGSFTPKELIKILEHKGFILKRIHGSHYYFVHPVTGKITSIPMHTRVLPKGTLHVILKQAGIDKSEI